ncbi:MAG: choice-of-anchor J domain-containing protein [Paludibacteraceae bacterium]|nr:choice-of-anchor J domain-containing protein [Paludibacteraceae bacterium]
MKKILSLFAAALFAGSMMAAEVLNIDFKASQGEWTIENVELGGLDFVWAQSQQYGMKATGYVNNTNHATEALLVSPAFDLSGVETAMLSFSHARKYGNLDQLSVLAKAGDGEWTALEVSAWPDGSSWAFVDATADLASVAGMADVKVAFKYTSSADAGATWEIASAAVYTDGEGPVVADVVFLPSDFAGQGTSSTGSEVTVTKDGVTISSNKAFGHEGALRVYKDGTFSIVSETEQIGKIVFSFGSYQGTAKDGGLASEIVVNANEWSVEAMASAAWFEKISIFFGEYDPIVPQGPDTISVAQAVAIAEALAEPAENGKSTTDTKEYVVKGFAVQVYPKNDDGTWSFFMADEAGAYGPFSASNTSTDADVVENDFMLVRGKIAKRKTNAGKIQLQIYKGTGVHGQAPQGIENVTLTEKAQKVMIDGVMYIVRDNKMYNAQGVQVR